MEKEVVPKEPGVTPKKPTKVVRLDAEQIASRKRAHDLKVAKFQAGGEF